MQAELASSRHKKLYVSLHLQILAEAQEQLKTVVQNKIQEAVAKQDHETVVRFVRLYIPLRLKVQKHALRSLLLRLVPNSPAWLMFDM